VCASRTRFDSNEGEERLREQSGIFNENRGHREEVGEIEVGVGIAEVDEDKKGKFDRPGLKRKYTM